MGVIPPWSDLPDELLSDISKRLYTNPLDILSFRSVCHSWLSSSPFSLSSSPQSLFSPLPLITPSPPDPLLHHYAIPNSNPSLLSGTAIFALRPQFDPDYTPSSMANAWVLFLDQPQIDKVSIRKPFSEIAYSMPMNFPDSIYLLKYRITELGRFYNLTYLPEDGGGTVSKPRDWFGEVLKIVLVSNGDGFAVVVLSHEGKLGLLRLGFGGSFENLSAGTNWEIIHDGRRFRFDDIIDFKGQVLGINRRGRMYEIEIGCSRNSSKVNVVSPPIAGGGGRRKRVVESIGRLYLVVRSNVLGKLLVSELLHDSHGKNCILFKEQSFRNYSGIDDEPPLLKFKQHDLHVSVWNLDDAAHLSAIRSHPGYSNVLWPPPTWIWPNHKSERVKTLLTELNRLDMMIPKNPVRLEIKVNALHPQRKVVALEKLKKVCYVNKMLSQAREIDKLLKKIEKISVSWKQHCMSANLQNRVGTSVLANEESCASLESFRVVQNAIKHGKSKFNLLSLEMKIHTCLLQLEEDTTEAKGTLNPALFLLYSWLGWEHKVV
uniref:KIB1-4 beta-propeller domain-containing protein n=1 Tax=Chenopodium quinoa TaxID=63459 RepID=A0A803KWM8_CHEQI